MSLASVDGAIMPLEQATVPATDEGFLRGYGAFEVVRLYAGRPYALEEHLERLAGSSRNLRLEPDLERLRAEVSALLERAGPVDALLRLVVTRAGHRLALVEPLPPHPPAVRLGYVTYAPTRVLDGVKSLSYAANLLATELARERGFDEALLVTPHGRVLEAPTSTLFWVAGGRARTPALSEHILDSITRRRVMATIEVEEAPCTPDELAAADEAFLASTVREVQPVSAIEDRELPAEGPVTARAAAGVRDQIARELALEPA